MAVRAKLPVPTSNVHDLRSFLALLERHGELTRPFQPRADWGGDRFSPVAHHQPEMVAQVKQRWREYGFTGWNREF